MAQQATTLLPEVRKHYGDLKNFIGGKWVDSHATEWLDDTNPATGGTIARVPFSPKEDIDAAVQAARSAWEEWRETPPISRGRYFFALRDLMEEHFEELARIVSQDQRCDGLPTSLTDGVRRPDGPVIDHCQLSGFHFQLKQRAYAAALVHGT